MAKHEVRYAGYSPGHDAVFLELTDDELPDAQLPGADYGAAMVVTVWFSKDRSEDGREPFTPAQPGRPLSVKVEAFEGLTPTMLQRFPWARWLAAADAKRRGEQGAFFDAIGLQLSAEEKRPGRKGHDLAHYQAVAKRYMELRAKGVEAPAKVIAHQDKFNESTVRGWIRRCRELELLPPGRPGRAG